MVSTTLALALALSGRQVLSQQKALSADWSRISPNVAVVSSGGRPMGLGVVVSADGVVLVHQSSIRSEVLLRLTVSGPMTYDALVVGRDPITGLVGVQAQNWPKGARTFAYVAAQDPPAKSLLVAATLAGPMQGQATNSNAAGHLASSNRFVPLTEVRFEQSSDRVAGAVLFNQMGELVGVLGATLADAAPNAPAPSAFSESSRGAGGFGGGGLARPLPITPDTLKDKNSFDNYGPQGMTTAYALGTPVLARVVRGLSSPGHQVKHPTIGIGFHDERDRNVVTKVDPQSTAEVSGLMVGDVITAMNGKQVRTSIELASALFQLEIGSTVPVTVLRDGTEIALRVKIAGS